MNKVKKTLKNLVYPVTLLTVILIICILLSIQAIYIAYTNNHTAAIYAAILIPITVFLLFLYAIDRFLVKRMPYLTLLTIELVAGLFIYLLFSYQNSYTDINFDTDKDYILVIFDANENSISQFNKKGIFGKELNIKNTNIIHLDSSLFLRKDLRINPPKDWKTGYHPISKNELKGDSIKYFYYSKEIHTHYYRRESKVYIDSLFKRELRK